MCAKIIIFPLVAPSDHCYTKSIPEKRHDTKFGKEGISLLLHELLLLNDLQHYSSIREAASALQQSESTLRSSIRHLENELECKLIVTNKKGYQLTATAHQILPHADILLHKMQELYKLHDYASQAFSGKITLASSSQFGALLLTTIISDLLKTYPQAQFSLILQSNQSLMEALVNNQLEIALMEIHDIEKPLLQNVLLGLPLQIDILMHDQMCFLIGPNHPLAGIREAPMETILRSSRLVNNDSTDSLTLTFLQRHGYRNTILRITNLIAQRQFIAESNAASWQTYHAAKNSLSLYQDPLQILTISDLDWQSTLYCVHQGTNSVEENTFMQRITQQMAQSMKGQLS